MRLLKVLKTFIILCAICTAWKLLFTALWMETDYTNSITAKENDSSENLVIQSGNYEYTVYKKNGLCYLYNPYAVPNCTQLYSLNSSSSLLGKVIAWQPNNLLTDSETLKVLKSPLFYRHCFPKAFSKAKNDFPIAYVLKVNKNLPQLIQLLQSIYRGQDVYCITYDLKSSAIFQEGVRAIARNLRNVVVPAKHERIVWAHFSELMASVNCIKRLIGLRHSWKYVLDQLMVDDLPLKSPNEIALTLHSLNGSTIIGAPYIAVTNAEHALRHRHPIWHISDLSPANWSTIHHPSIGHITTWTSEEGRYYRLDDIRRPAVPHGIRLYKGIGMAASRKFAHFGVVDARAMELLHWLQGSYVPYEHFHASLCGNSRRLDAPICRGSDQPFLRYQVWWSKNFTWKERCHGKRSHFSCVFGVADLPRIIERPELFLHKITLDVQPVAYHCIREHVNARNDKLAIL